LSHDFILDWRWAWERLNTLAPISGSQGVCSSCGWHRLMERFLENGDIVLVRGGDLDPVILGADTARYHGVYGIYGISVFAVRDVTVDGLAQQVPLVRFDRLSRIT
jgi:hypothetical protein